MSDPGKERTAEKIYEMAARFNDVLGAMSCSATMLLNCLTMERQLLTEAELNHFKLTALEMTVQLCDYAPVANDLAHKLQRSLIKVNERLIEQATETATEESER